MRTQTPSITLRLKECSSQMNAALQTTNKAYRFLLVIFRCGCLNNCSIFFVIGLTFLYIFPFFQKEEDKCF